MDSPLSRPALLALSLLLLALYLARRHLARGKNRTYPPVAGTVLHQVLNFGRLVEYQTELSRRYPTFRMLTPTCNYVYTVEPANVEYILKTNFANYGKGVMTHDVMEDLLGDGIFNVDGAKWRHQRKVASHEFSTRVLRDYSSAVFRDTAAELAGIVAAAARGAGERLDISDLLMRSTLDSIFEIGFGVNLGSLTGSSEEGAAFARAFDDASEQVLYRFFDLFWKVKRFFSIASEAAMKRSVRTIDGFVYAVIDRKIEQMGRNHQEFVSSSAAPLLDSRSLQPSPGPVTFNLYFLTRLSVAGQERGHPVEVPARAGARPRLLRQQVPAGHHPQLRDRRPRHHGGDPGLVPLRALQEPARPGKDRGGGARRHRHGRPRRRRAGARGVPDRGRHRQDAVPARRAGGDAAALPGRAHGCEVLLLGRHVAGRLRSEPRGHGGSTTTVCSSPRAPSSSRLSRRGLASAWGRSSRTGR
ncbi:hypothetical protein PVAP13_7KG295306 [Panicum virgatum]|uniref:Uncharacterized protein n=1 Tax=Panicum virgatum TaxID=38727 RepID=A0A8T0QKD4_PANVG|nr:hypothetical protein PVAP13_7KG295306 [Panicum virgatum]